MLGSIGFDREDSSGSASSSLYDSTDLTNCMPNGKVITLGDMEYERRKKFFFNAALHDLKPKAFAEVETVEDVRCALKYCLEKNFPLCIVSGGHSDYGTKNGAFVIKLSGMKRVVVDVASRNAFVEPGALLGDLDAATAKHNLATPLGTSTTVGIGGQALDLGMGFLSRIFGFLIDNVIEYEMIKADGEIIKVNRTFDPELFWAMKGHGSNFGLLFRSGIVTRYTIKLHEIPPLVLGGCCYFPWHEASTVLKHLRDFQRKLEDRKLVLNAMLHIGKSRFQVIYRLLYVGDLEKGRLIVDQLLSTCPVESLLCDIQPVSYDVFQRSCDHMYEQGLYFYQSAELNDQYIGEMTDAMSTLSVEQNYCSTVYFNALGEAVKEFSNESSPFLFRDANWWVGAVGSSSSKSGYDNVCRILDEAAVKLSPCAMPVDQVKLTGIVNRLKRVKIRYDPKNVFCHNPCNIGLHDNGNTLN
eukprot:gene15810-17405_t